MKMMILSAALAITMGAQAQQAAPVAPATVDLHLAGQHIEKAGKMRNTAMFTALGMGLLGGAAAAAMDADQRGGAFVMVGLGACIGIGLNIGANNREKKAGRILQGKP